MDVFDLLPIAAVVSGQYLCMHGGISDNITSLTEINQIDRKQEPPDDGILCDLLWADPAEAKHCGKDYVFNEKRQISVIFGKRPVNKFLDKEQLKCIVRAHEVKQKGYKFHLWNGKDEFPPVITVFSAPNYSQSDNQASVLIADGDSVDLRTFAERKDKPFIFPNRMNAIEALMPRMTGLILDCLANFLQTGHSMGNPVLKRALTKEASADQEYIDKVILGSLD